MTSRGGLGASAARLFWREEAPLRHRPRHPWLPAGANELDEATEHLDDPWEGEDERWDLAEERTAGPGEFLRLFRGVALAALLSVPIWAALVYVVVRLLT